MSREYELQQQWGRRRRAALVTFHYLLQFANKEHQSDMTPEVESVMNTHFLAERLLQFFKLGGCGKLKHF